MMKIKSYKITFIILISSIILIIIFGATFYDYFLKVKINLKNQTFNYLIKEVNNIAKNIETYNERIYKDLKIKLFQDPKEREKYNLYLSSFITINYKNLFIVYKDEKSKFFRVIADGALNKKDRFDFNEKFEPKFYKKWCKVLETKKPLYFVNDIKGLWMTYLYPVVKNNNVKYIIVIDFSIKPLNMIEKNLISLRNLFIWFIVILIFLVVVLSFFILYDLFRQRRMQKLLFEISELNKNLQKKVEEEVKRSREKDRQLIMQSRMALMGELLSMIAHQWRQPLNVLGGIVSNIELDLEFGNLDKKELKKELEKLKVNIKYLSNTIDDFRKFYRKDTQKVEINAPDVIEEIIGIIKPSLDSKNINLIKIYSCKTTIKTLKNELKQVILNLIKNAEDILIEKKIKNPYIEIRVFEEDNKCIIEIKDNGGGVDEKIKEKIFEPYFTTKDEKNGTGLGLYMSKSIIEKRLNGRLSFYNDEDGAVFRIELGAADGHQRDS